MGREFELKYAATAEKQAAIAEAFGNFASISMETTYYDTADRLLAAQRITLRRRLENGKSVCTLKTPAADGSRGEWETEQETIKEALPVLCKLSGVVLPQNAKLVAVCGARFTRLAKTVAAEGCTVELALDRGVLLGGSKEAPLCEVEVELKSGSETAAISFASTLAEKYALSPEPKSKFRRAMALTERQIGI